MNRSFNSLVVIAFLTIGCSISSNPNPIPTPLTSLPSLPAQAPTIIPSPTLTPNPFPNPVLKVTGQEEVVFDWTTDHCEAMNLPDLPSRAFRGADGQVQLILSHSVNYRMIGPDLNNVKIDCNPIMRSKRNADANTFRDMEWIAAPYTEDGQTVYAVIHDEYHGWEHRGQCSKYSMTVAYFPCWYNALTLAISADGGKTYAPATDPPGHLVANLPFQYKADAGPSGLRGASNIIKGKDGYYYEFANVAYYADDEQWVCLMRTQNLSDPTSWRFWDGDGFDGKFVNPYTTAPEDPDSHVCPALEWDNIGASMNDSITYNTYLNRYVLVGISADTIGGRLVWGYYYSFSDDLIHWTRRKLLLEIALPWTVKNGGSDLFYSYPSLLDPDSESRNFESTDKTAYLYYTRMNHGWNLDRDLIRVPVEFFPSESEAGEVMPERTATRSPDPISMSVLKKDQSVPAQTPIELTFSWETATAEQTSEFLANLQLEVLLDGRPMPKTMDGWGEIEAAGNGRYSAQWRYALGVLSAGEHSLNLKMTLAKPVTDGLGNNYSGDFFENSMRINVGN